MSLPSQTSLRLGPGIRSPSAGIGRFAALAVITGAISVIAALISIRATADYLSQPWGKGDAPFFYTLAANLIRHGWITYNPDIGFPYAMDLAHFPMPEFRSWGLLTVISWFTQDPILA